MKTVELLEKLRKLPLFTENDAAKIVNKSQKYIRTLLYRMCKSGFIKRIERGKYTPHKDPLIFLSYITTPSYIGLWTALRYYGMTGQQPFSFFVITLFPKKSINYEGIRIKFAATKHMFGYKKERYSDFDIFISDREKTIIDSLLFKIPVQDVNVALEDKEINHEKLANYAKRTGNAALMKRLGYLLEKRKGKSYGLRPLDSNYALLDYHGKGTGKKDAKWRVIINTKL